MEASIQASCSNSSRSGENTGLAALPVLKSSG
jgi:hypothetical protein